jgi:hypothetical protein
VSCRWRADDDIGAARDDFCCYRRQLAEDHLSGAVADELIRSSATSVSSVTNQSTAW